jgi:hypothetical protein
MCNLQNTTFYEFCIQDLIFPIGIAITTYLLVKKIDEWRDRKTFSILGVLIIESLIEEVETGLGIMDNILNPNNVHNSTSLLPDKSWSGMTTIPDNVLLRIIAVSKNVKPLGFHPRQIRIHCKNYFININSNWKLMINSGPNWLLNTQNLLRSGHYDGTKGVLAMLKQTRDLLDKNSRKMIPE